ncbi:MAG TPA: type II toxin-antitoxin system Phd/YefM family antitoxin [Rhodanobacter sp.]|nr:type II toxin-antitoxin system Phd/YefM family antitoxin [Rhodanobacter sp.]
MTITTLSSREFNQHASDAKKASERGPVFITDRGRPAHVLLSIADYEKLTGRQPTIVELLASPEAAAIDFDPPRLRDGLIRPTDLE